MKAFQDVNMEIFNVKEHDLGDSGWELISAISPGHAARIYGAALAAKMFIGRNLAMKIDVQASTNNAPLLTFYVDVDLRVDSKLISKQEIE